jgi:hypothetical protein
MEKPGIVGFRHLFGGDNPTHTLCEWLRMKFSAGFLQWEPSEASRGYEFNRPTRDVLNQNLEPRDVLCFPNECSDEVWNKAAKRAHYKGFDEAKPASARCEVNENEETPLCQEGELWSRSRSLWRS